MKKIQFQRMNEDKKRKGALAKRCPFFSYLLRFDIIQCWLGVIV